MTRPAENSGSPTRALGQEGEAAAQVPNTPIGPGVDPEPLVRLLVELSATTVDLLLGGRWLRPDEVDDPLAVLLALRRVGLTPTVSRLP